MPSNPFSALALEDDEDAGTTTKAPEEAPKVKPTQPQQAQAAKSAGKTQSSQAAPAKPAGEHKDAAPKQNQPPRQRKPRAPPAEGTVASNTESDAFDKPKGERRQPRRDNREGHNQRNERQSHHKVQKGGEQKKEGHGVGNWGSTKEEIVEEAKAAVEGEPQTPAAAVDGETGAPAEPKEEEPKTVSYEEFKKQQASKRAAVPSLPSVRQAGEGDKTKWEATQLIVKEEEDDSNDKLSSERKSQRAFKKQTVAIDVQFAGTPERAESSPREGGFRGGRGGGRGASRGGRGGNTNRPPRSSNGGDSKPPAFNIEADFPKL